MEVKNCPNCGNSFVGRANRAYCSTSCKSAINNSRIFERDKQANNIANHVKTNRRILMQLYSIYGEIELPPIVIDKTPLNKVWHSWISANGKKQLFLDMVLEHLPNSNFLIHKLTQQ
jgi:hypothetical protein